MTRLGTLFIGFWIAAMGSLRAGRASHHLWGALAVLGAAPLLVHRRLTRQAKR